MTHADTVLSASRRRLLAMAGCVAVFPATALTAAAAPTGGLSAAPPIEDAVRSALIETKAEVDDSLTLWLDLDAECKRRDRILKKWETQHPFPNPYSDECVRNPRARSDWQARQLGVMRKLELGKIKGERNDVGDAFHSAVKAFAAMDAENVAELIFKVETGIMMDDGNGTIARSVLFDILALKRRGEFPAVAA